MSKEKEMKQYLQQYDKDTLIELYLQKDFDAKQQLAEKDKEIDELEQEREFMLDEVKNRGTCGLCEKLENKEINELRQQLAEKDKEIKELKERVIEEEDFKLAYKHDLEQTRHQICEEIKEKLCLAELKKTFKNANVECGEIRMSFNLFCSILDQIEKGEER